jgi:hypothetical protein
LTGAPRNRERKSKGLRERKGMASAVPYERAKLTGF